MQGVDICMTVKYNIEVPNECSADFWKTLTEKFDIVLTRRQHSVDGETLYIEGKITKIRPNNFNE